MKRPLIVKDPVCGKNVNRSKAHITIKYKGNIYFLCSVACKKEFKENPEEYAGQNAFHRKSI
jgi:YHS domain-containing protein